MNQKVLTFNCWKEKKYRSIKVNVTTFDLLTNTEMEGLGE